jgi:hypothetical protein
VDTSICLNFGESIQEERLAFLALPAKRASEQVTGTANELFGSIQVILSRIVSDVIEKRTREEFCAAREAHFPQYVRVMLALSSLVSTVVPRPTVDRLTWESMSEMESEFRGEAISAFGKDICDQALFTIWTLRKVHNLASQIGQQHGPRKDLLEQDQRLATDFVWHILYSRFHLDCLNLALRTGTVIYPQPMEAISDGLRALVNAYAYVRQAVDLRSGRVEEEVINIDFDDEERELVGLAMRDFGATNNLGAHA